MGTQEITLRVANECPDIAPLWDSVITQNGMLEIDWALAGLDEGFNYGGLQAKAMLHTAVIQCIWTDKWSKANEVAKDQDPRGWWGDGIDTQGYPEMGSEMWTLFRGRLNADTGRKAVNYCRSALQTLITQGAVASFEVAAEVNVQAGILIVNIQGFSQTGSKVYDQRWSFVWNQLSV